MGNGIARPGERPPGHEGDEQPFSKGGDKGHCPEQEAVWKARGGLGFHHSPQGSVPVPPREATGEAPERLKQQTTSAGTRDSHLCWAVAHPPTCSWGSAGPGQSSAWSRQSSPAFRGDFLSALLFWRKMYKHLCAHFIMKYHLVIYSHTSFLPHV